MNNIEELKPCPFCGGKAHLLTSNGSFLVECSVCLTDFLNGPVGIGWYRSEKDAAAGWNDRPIERALIAQLEAAQKLISEDGKLQYIRRLEAEKQTESSTINLQRRMNLELMTENAGLKDRAEKAEAALSAANEKLKGEQVPVEYQYRYHNHGTGSGEWCRVLTKERYEELQREHAGDNDFAFRTLFTAPQKPVVLSSSTVMSRAYVVQAIKAAGFTVEGE